jgi:hypothetical protein
MQTEDRSGMRRRHSVPRQKMNADCLLKPPRGISPISLLLAYTSSYTAKLIKYNGEMKQNNFIFYAYASTPQFHCSGLVFNQTDPFPSPILTIYNLVIIFFLSSDIKVWR